MQSYLFLEIFSIIQDLLHPVFERGSGKTGFHIYGAKKEICGSLGEVWIWGGKGLASAGHLTKPEVTIRMRNTR